MSRDALGCGGVGFGLAPPYDRRSTQSVFINRNAATAESEIYHPYVCIYVLKNGCHLQPLVRMSKRKFNALWHFITNDDRDDRCSLERRAGLESNDHRGDR